MMLWESNTTPTFDTFKLQNSLIRDFSVALKQLTQPKGEKLITAQKEFKVFTKPQEVLVQMLQEAKALLTPANNSDYYPYKGA